MKSLLKISLASIILSCLFLIVSAANGRAQKGVAPVAESAQYMVTSEFIKYSYKYKGKKVEATKFDHYKLAKKSDSVELARYTRFMKFGNIAGLFEVGNKDQLGILNLETGQMVIPATYKRFYPIGDSIIGAKAKTETIFDLQGKKLIDVAFKKVQFHAKERLIYDTDDKNLTFYNYSGKLVATFPNTRLHTFHQKEMILEQDGKFGIYTVEGKEVLPFEYADIFYGDQYLTLGKKTESGIQYGMFTRSNLKNQLFPFEYDYLRDISISKNFNDFESGFMVYDKNANSIRILAENKEEFTRFDRFENVKAGWEAAKRFVSLEVIYDYFAVATTSGTYRIFLHNGESISDEEFDFCTHFENIFPGHVFFQGTNTLILPWKYKSSREYNFPFALYDITRLSDKAYSISTDYGDNIFRPFSPQPLVNAKYTEVSMDYNLLDNYKIAYFTDYSGTKIAYDVLNDSLIFSHTPKDKNSHDLLFNYMSPKITEMIKMMQVNHPVSDIKVTSDSHSGLFTYSDQDYGTILEDVSYNLNFSIVENGNLPGGKFFAASLEIDEEPYWSMNLILDSRLQVVKPFSKGTPSGVYTFDNDTVFVSGFFSFPDSTQIYSTHHKKLITYKYLADLSGETYFYPNITRHGIMNYEGKNGLCSYDGKLIVPFTYDLIDFFDGEYIARTVLEFRSRKSRCYYFTEPKVLIQASGAGYENEHPAQNSNAYIMTVDNGYKIYDLRTAKPFQDQTFTSVEYIDPNRYMIVGIQESYGIFDLQEMVLAEDLKYNSEDIYQVFSDKYTEK